MVDPREYASRCAKPVASGSGSVPGSDSGTAGPDSDDGPGSFLPGSGSVFCSGTSGLGEAMLVETPSTCRDDLIGAGGEEVEVEMEARPELSVGHRGGNEAGDEEVCSTHGTVRVHQFQISVRACPVGTLALLVALVAWRFFAATVMVCAWTVGWAIAC